VVPQQGQSWSLKWSWVPVVTRIMCLQYIGVRVSNALVTYPNPLLGLGLWRLLWPTSGCRSATSGKPMFYFSCFLCFYCFFQVKKAKIKKVWAAQEKPTLVLFAWFFPTFFITTLLFALNITGTRPITCETCYNSITGCAFLNEHACQWLCTNSSKKKADIFVHWWRPVVLYPWQRR